MNSRTHQEEARYLLDRAPSLILTRDLVGLQRSSEFGVVSGMDIREAATHIVGLASGVLAGRRRRSASGECIERATAAGITCSSLGGLLGPID
jgi:hypothetical protein